MTEAEEHLHIKRCKLMKIKLLASNIKRHKIYKLKTVLKS